MFWGWGLVFRVGEPIVLQGVWNRRPICTRWRRGGTRALVTGGRRMRNPLLVPDLRELIQAGEHAVLREFFSDHHPAQIAEILEDLDTAEGYTVVDLLPARLRAQDLT